MQWTAANAYVAPEISCAIVDASHASIMSGGMAQLLPGHLSGQQEQVC